METQLPSPAADQGFSDSPPCTNCGAGLLGDYCLACGQHRRSLHNSLWAFLAEMVSELFESDARLWRTLGPLFFRPGYLSHDYLAGRRARYLPPLRLYLGASLLFFLFTALLGGSMEINLDGDESAGRSVVTGLEPAQLDALRAQRAMMEQAEDGAPATAQSKPERRREIGAAVGGALGEAIANGSITPEEAFEVLDVVDDGAGDSDRSVSFELDEAELPDWLRAIAERLERGTNHMLEDPQGFFDAAAERAPTALFLTLPIFALLTRLLWFGSGRWYVEHLVFALHLYALFFLALSLKLICDWLGRSESIITVFASTANTGLTLYLFWYWLAGFRRFFQCSWGSTILRSAFLVMAYAVVLLIAFLIVTVTVLLAD